MLRFVFLFFSVNLGITAKTLFKESFPCPPTNIYITDQWYMPPTLMSGHHNCSFNLIYQFNFPPDTFAEVEVWMTSIQTSDVVIIENEHMDEVWMSIDFCSGPCTSFNTSSLWPDLFNLRIQASPTTNMVVEVRITLQKSSPLHNVVNTVTTTADSPSNLIYFDDWKEGTSYTFVSNSSSLDYKIAAIIPSTDDELFSSLQNIFIYDGGEVAGTLQHVFMAQDDLDIVSDTNMLTLYLARKVNIRGAVFVTDRTNTEYLAEHSIEYVPVDKSGQTSFADVPGQGHQPGAVTIVGDKDGSTPIDIRQLNNGGNGGEFTYLAGGPKMSYGDAVEIKNRNLPLHLGGNMNTIYISKGEGHVKYTTTGN